MMLHSHRLVVIRSRTQWTRFYECAFSRCRTHRTSARMQAAPGKGFMFLLFTSARPPPTISRGSVYKVKAVQIPLQAFCFHSIFLIQHCIDLTNKEILSESTLFYCISKTLKRICRTLDLFRRRF